MKMREAGSLHDRVIDRNWVLKRKRKRVSCRSDLVKREGSSLPTESPRNYTSVKQKLKGEISSSRNSHKIKGHDGYYFECVECDLGGNLLCCDSCPRTYHLECLNPPLKRTPPGKWHCPCCRGQKDPLKLAKTADMSSRKARRKNMSEQLNSVNRSSRSDFASLAENNSSHECKFTNRSQTTTSYRGSSIEKKPDVSEADTSCNTKSSQFSEGGLINGNLTQAQDKVEDESGSFDDSKNYSNKETHSSIRTLDAGKISSEAKTDEMQQKKLVIHLERLVEKSKKKKQKFNRRDKKKRPAGKGQVVPLPELAMTQMFKEASPRSEPRRSLQKRKSISQQNSWSVAPKRSKIQKLSRRKQPERSPEEASPSSGQCHEQELEADRSIQCHDNLLDGTQQVDRILGCRMQSTDAVLAYSPRVKFSSHNCVKSGSNLGELANELSPCNTNPDMQGILSKEPHDDSKNSDTMVVDTLHAEGCCSKTEGKDYNGNICDNSVGGEGSDAKRVSDTRCAPESGIMEKSIESPKDPCLTMKNSEIIDKSVVNLVDDKEKPEKESLEVDTDIELAVTSSHSHSIKEDHSHVSFRCDSEDVPHTTLDAQPDGSVVNHLLASTTQDFKAMEKDKLEYEFLVKWMGQSNIHNSWVSESQLKILAKRKLENYKAKYGTALINICGEQWSIPQRVISLRASKDGNNDEALVKWSGLPYDECTWEKLEEPVIRKFAHLIDELKKFELQAMEKDVVDDVSSAEDDLRELVSLGDQPKELRGGSLFPHQLEALNWLRKCWHRSKNVILADEMGLGKTVSACAFISSLYVEFKVKLPCLVLVPLSTMPNWMSEFASWTPHLNVVEYHGSAKARAIIRQYEWRVCDSCGVNKRDAPYKFNVLLTTYEMVLADSSHLRGVPWEVLVVDEGHRLKNSSSKLFGLLNSFSFQHRVLLTGTPLQNNIGEMYNLLNFLQPASFPSLSAFEEKFNDLTNTEKVEELKKLVAPHMLRRLKKDAMQNIPPKTERIVPVELSSIQAEYYRAMLTKNYQILRNIGKGGVHQSLLNIVMQLRKVCNHPYLISGTEPESGTVDFLQEMRIKASGKLTLLHSMLKILNKEGHRVLIFSQMTKLLDILEDYLTIEYGPKTFERVDGSVSVADRQAAIARFNQDKSRFVFLLSTRSCGLGINLATADTVIIYDSDFNPHADIQAMNRAHRIGQSNRLLVYRLVVRASVEERILQLAKKKLMLDQLFVNKSESQKEVEDIIRWGTEELFRECNDVAGKDTKESSTGIVETLADGEVKHRRRGGGLGDVYQDKCTDGSSKIVWDDNAIIKLLDRDNLHSPVPESTDGDLENDMLGSVKSPEWNDDSNEDLGGTEPFPAIIGDGSDQATEVKEDNVPSVAEENEWDRLLRLRWEKYQIEEEAALGRGKRLRKAVSYKETFANIQSEALSESANEDEEPEPEYTAAGRALKEKYAKLRARQKERLARRHMMEADFPTGRPDLHVHPLIPTCKETESSQKMVDEALAQVPQINAGDTIVSEDKDRMAWQARSSKHGVKRLHSSHLDFPDRPPESTCPDTLIASHQFKNRKYPNLLPTSNHLPVLGLCAPNASQADSSSRKFQSFLSLQPSNHEHRRASIEMPDFPFPTASRSGPLCPTIKDAQTTVGMPLHPETSGEALHQRPKDLIPDSYLPFFHGPPTTSKGSHEEPLDCSSFAAFQEKMALPSLGVHERPLPKFPLLSMNSARPLHMDLFPNLSLSTNLDHASTSIEDHPNIPLVPTFRQQMNESLKLKQQMVELPPLFGLGSMHASQYSLPENHKRVLDSIIMRTGTARSKFSKKRVKVDAWTEDELDALWIGVRRHGRGNWDAMLRDPKLKFSKHKTSGDLSMRWAEEQLKVLDGAPMTASRSLRASFPGISDGMMTRALLGSKFANLGTEQPMFRSHLTDIQLGCRDLASSFPPIDPRNQFGTINDSFPPLPLWLTDKMKSSLSADFDVGPSDRPGNLNLPMDQPFELNPLSVGKNFESPSINHSASCDTQKTEDQPCTNKYLKLPNFLDRSFDPILDRHNNVPVGEAIAGRPPDMQNKQNSNNSPINNDAGCGSSSTNKLPHWLRDAVSLPPTKPPEPVLPPTVSAIAQSVRLLYGEEKRTIPPFTIPGPPLFQPTDPRKHLKRKRKSHKLRQATLEILIGNKSSEVASLSSTPPAPNASTSNVPSVGPIPSLPSLSLDLNSPSSSSFASQEKKSSTMLSPSPDVLQFASSSEVPQTCGSPTHIPSTTCQANEMPSTKDVETSEPAGNGMNEDLTGFSGRLTESENLLVESWEIITKDEIQQFESGDSRKTKSNTCKGDQDISEETSSEETESVNHQSHHDS